ncbi:MAG TPA: hypothetical protein PLH19_14365 [Anaerolineae bacterium]|nr:hypothetical protein [Anaerolineae bacterium]HQH39701.1 hypothetical protein [Anaerolineae bacterium]
MRICQKIDRLIITGIVIVLSASCTNTAISPIASPTMSPIASPTFDSSIEYGISQDQPAPIGAPVKTEDGLIITVVEAKRNSEEELVSINPFNMFNPNEEAILIRAKVELPKAPPEPFTLLSFDFDIMDETGTVYGYPLTVIVADELKAYLDRATTIEGYLAFVLPRGHTQLVMRYLPKNRGQAFSPRWFILTP